MFKTISQSGQKIALWVVLIYVDTVAGVDLHVVFKGEVREKVEAAAELFEELIEVEERAVVVLFDSK